MDGGSGSRGPVKQLTIRQELKVGWFAVRQLLATGVQALLATLVGSMSGRRETMAALDPQKSGAPNIRHDYSGMNEVWIDYVADTGDGFDATHSVAWLVGRRAVTLKGDLRPTKQPIPADNPEPWVPPAGRAGELSLPAGHLLVFGGDQVYPAASAQGYQSRLQDPYQSALFYEVDPARAGQRDNGRHVFAIPGNHDWYDGLTAFIRLFCQTTQRWIGGWRTQQRRSYFVLKLPGNWWLWGVDTALAEDVDPPQLDYLWAQAKALRPGDRVILCVPTPTWIKEATEAAQQGSEGVRGRDIQQEVNRLSQITQPILRNNATVPVIISGDLHHYVRHASSERQYFVCGGGGAFSRGTARSPAAVDLDGAAPADLRSAFPSAEESRALRWGALQFPWRSRGFTSALALYQLALVYAFNLASQLNPEYAKGGKPDWLHFLHETDISLAGIGEIAGYIRGFLPTAPITVGLLLLFLFGTLAFSRSGRPFANSRWPVLAGFVNWLLLIVAGIACTWVAAKHVPPDNLVDFQRILQLFAFLVIEGLLLYFASGFLFGAYLLVTNLLCGMHEQEVYSCQALESHKSFLRMKVDQDGVLTIHPIGLRKVGKAWVKAPGVADARKRRLIPGADVPLEVPEKASRIFDPKVALEPHLIEPPIVVGRQG